MKILAGTILSVLAFGIPMSANPEDSKAQCKGYDGPGGVCYEGTRMPTLKDPRGPYYDGYGLYYDWILNRKGLLPKEDAQKTKSQQ